MVLAVLVAVLAIGARPALAGPLPKLAVSLPASTGPAEAAKLLQACGDRDAVLVLPPFDAHVGDEPQQALVEQLAASPSTVPAGAYLRLRLQVGEVAAAGSEREQAVQRQVTDIVARLQPGRPEVAGLVIEPSLVGQGQSVADVAQFALATLIVKARGAKQGLQIALALPDAFPATAAQRLLAYADMLLVDAAALAGPKAADVVTLAAGRPVIARLTVGGPDDARGGSTAFLAELTDPGARAASILWLDLAGPASLRGLCNTVRVLGRSLDAGFEMTAPERAPAAVLADGRPVSSAVAFVGSRTADVAILVRAGGSREAPRTLSLAADLAGKTPQVSCVDAVDGRTLDVRRDQAPSCRADAEFVMFLAKMPSGGDRLFESVNVSGRSSLRVEEVIARWQAAREAERAVLDNYTVPCFLVLHFEATSLAAGVDIALELQQLWRRDGVNDWVQTAFRVNGVKLRRGQEFPLPQLEPDKVVTKPLELRIEDKYVYELLGTDTVEGHVCYVVGIKPGEGSESLYSGKIWIDGVDFRQVRLQLEQRDGRNNVASHIETQSFERVKDAQGREFTLVRAIDAQDSINLAGRSITLEKRYRFGDYLINAGDFAARLAAARASDDPMFRDTENGLRTLRKEGTERVVESTVNKRVSAAVLGALYDGSRSYPVPLPGISWVDFDFRKTGTQFSAFFAGAIFVANLSKQVDKRFRWGIDLSLSALPTTYYQYSGDKEITGGRLRGFEQWAGGLVAYQVTPAVEVSAQAHLYYNLFQTVEQTDPAYRPPASGLTLNLYGEAKYTKKGFSAIGSVEQGRRFSWHQYGDAASNAPVLPNWTRYSATLSQHLFVGKLTRGGVSAGYYGGHNLDRFSRYLPSFLGRPSINGLPSGADSFDEVTTAGAYYGFNVMDLAKLQGDYTHAWTRNRDEGNALRQFDGLNFSIGVAGPFGTFVQGSVSVLLNGSNLGRYQSRWGTYIIFLKPWKK